MNLKEPDFTKSCRERGDNVQNCHSCPDTECGDNMAHMAPASRLAYFEAALSHPLGPQSPMAAALDALNLPRIEDNDIMTSAKPEPVEAVKSPIHYTFGKYECWDVVDDWGLDYYLGTVLKYICRAGRKVNASKKTDLRKAREFLDRAISKLP